MVQKVKVFTYVGQRSRSREQNFGMIGKALSQGMYAWNMKALPLMVQKVWQRLKFLEMLVKIHGQGHKVIHYRVIERVSLAEYTC